MKKLIQKSGILLVNKPKNITCNDVLKQLKQKYIFNKIGHTGTLDKFAFGLIIITVNNATKIQDMIMINSKEYIVKIKLGYFTDTLDITGEIFAYKKISYISTIALKQIIDTFLGDIEQIPPVYSAIKYQGKRLAHHYVSGDFNKLNIKNFARKIKIFSIDILSNEKESILLKINCSKGTYIRALVRDICLATNNYGVCEELQRIKIGNYLLKNAHLLDSLNITDNLITINNILNAKEIVNNNSIEIESISKKIPNICINPVIQNEYIYINLSQYNQVIYKKIIENMYGFFMWNNIKNENN